VDVRTLCARPMRRPPGLRPSRGRGRPEISKPYSNVADRHSGLVASESKRPSPGIARWIRGWCSHCGNSGPPPQHLVSIKLHSGVCRPARASAPRAARSPTWLCIAWPFGSVS